MDGQKHNHAPSFWIFLFILVSMIHLVLCLQPEGNMTSLLVAYSLHAKLNHLILFLQNVEFDFLTEEREQQAVKIRQQVYLK